MSALFTPFKLRDVSFKNRIAVSPMSQYRAKQGFTNDWHLVHLGRFALGGAGLIYVEATAVEADGRRTAGDIGLWTDDQISGLKNITTFLSSEGSVPGIQLSHAGRKASERRPWHGETPIDKEDKQLRDEDSWQSIGPSAVPYADGWPAPLEMSHADIQRVINAFGEAAARAHRAGFKMIEIYAAHGFLIHQFLSPIANHRSDKWGGSPSNRSRFAIEVAKSIRTQWPDELPLAFRLSATDWLDNGLEIDDTVIIARHLKEAGVDMIDVSSGGISGKERPRRMELKQGFQVPFATQISQETDLATMGVGFLWDADVCEQLIAKNQVDMIALARELLANPNWPQHAAQQLGLNNDHDLAPVEAGWWLMKRDRLLNKLGIR